MYKSHIQAN